MRKRSVKVNSALQMIAFWDIITLTMEAVRTYETLVYVYETTRRHIPEGCLHTRCRETLKPHLTGDLMAQVTFTVYTRHTDITKIRRIRKCVSVRFMA
jgi:hypothetical protein